MKKVERIMAFLLVFLLLTQLVPLEFKDGLLNNSVFAESKEYLGSDEVNDDAEPVTPIVEQNPVPVAKTVYSIDAVPTKVSVVKNRAIKPEPIDTKKATTNTEKPQVTIIPLKVSATPTGIKKPKITLSPSATPTIVVKEKEDIKTEILVKYKNGGKKESIKSAVKKNRSLKKLNTRKSMRKSKVELLEIDKSDNLESVIDEFKKNEDVEYVQPNYKLKIQKSKGKGKGENSVAGDVYSNELLIKQWGISNNGQTIEGQTGKAGVDINLIPALKLDESNSEIVVGILDTGVDINNAIIKKNVFVNTKEIHGNGIDDDLNGLIDDENGWDFVNNDSSVFDDASIDEHGTFIAGILASVSPRIKIMPLKFINGDEGTTADAIEAIEYAKAMGVRILNCSWGSDKSNYALAKAMLDSGILFLCSAGNDGNDGLIYPAAYNFPNVLSVAAIDNQGCLATFSNYGDKVQVAAPGANIYSVLPDGKYGFKSGSSFAAPYVSGIAGLMALHDAKASNRDIAARIIGSVTKLEGLKGKVKSEGLVNASEALKSELVWSGEEVVLDPKDFEEGTSVETLEDDYDYSQINSYIYPKSNANDGAMKPFSIGSSGQQENMYLENGNFELKQTDLSLKGINGLDFNLTRTYNLFDADITKPVYTGEETIFSRSRARDITACGYKVKSRYKISDDSLIQELSRESVEYDDISGQEYLAQTYDICNNYNSRPKEITYKNNAQGYYEAITYVDFKPKIYPSKKTYNYNGSGKSYVKDTAKKNTFCQKYYNIGQGWFFDFPVIEFDENAYDTFWLHFGSKGTWNFKIDKGSNGETYTKNFVLEDNNNKYSFSMTYKQINIVKYGNVYYPNINFYSAIYTDENGTKYEFEGFSNYDYGRIKSITDKYNNSIFFYYPDTNSGLVSKIVDTVKREINFTYSDTKVTVSVNDPNNTNDTKEIVYTKGTIDDVYVLKSVKNLEGQFTNYEYNYVDQEFSFEEALWLSSDGSGSELKLRDPATAAWLKKEDGRKNGVYKRACLSKVIYPTNGYTVYNYTDPRFTIMDMGKNGSRQYVKLKDRAEFTEAGVKCNFKSFTYDGYLHGFDGYPSENYFGYTVNTDVKDDLGNSEKHTFKYFYDVDNSYSSVTLRETNILKESNNNKQEIEKNYSGSQKPYLLPTYIITKNYNKATNAYVESCEKYEYDKLKVKNYWDSQTIWTKSTASNGDYNGNLVMTPTDNDAHKTSFTYNEKYGYLTSKTYKKDATTTILEQYTPTSDEKSVEYATIKENGIEKKKTRFVHDTFGNVTEKYDYKDDMTNFIVTKYGYTDNVPSRNGKFNGLYLTAKWNDGIKDADGNDVTPRAGIKSGTIDENYWYDYFGNMTDKMDVNGNVTSYQYDKLGRVRVEKHPDTSFKQWDYDNTANSVTIKDENGNKQLVDYDEFGNMLTVKELKSGKVLKSCTYDKYFRLETESNSDGTRVTTYSYYDDGRLKRKEIKDKSANKVISAENYTYNDAFEGKYNKVTKEVEGDANSPTIKTNTYINKYGQVEKVGRLHQEGAELKEYIDTYVYDYLGNKTEEKSARAYEDRWNVPWTTKYEYNFEGKVTKTTNVEGKFTTTEYDALGRVSKVTDYKGSTVTYTYDDLGRVIKETIPFETVGNTTYYTEKRHYYDGNGNVTTEKVSNNLPGQTRSFSNTEYEYNNRNMLTKVNAYNGYLPENFTQYYYDSVGNKLRMYTGLNRALTIKSINIDDYTKDVVDGADKEFSTTRYKYDSLNRLISTIDPLGQEEKYTEYDYDNNLRKKVDRNGNEISMDYDKLNRLLSTSAANASDPSVNVKNTYNYTLTGTRQDASGGGTTSGYIYDDLGRLKIESETGGIVKEYSYDAANNRKSFVLKQNGIVKENVSYSYDSMNRLYQVFENGATTPVTTYGYDANGNRSFLAYSNGNTTDYQYNLANKLTKLTNLKGKVNDSNAVILSKYDYTYYLDGNQETKRDNTGIVTRYKYDGLGRLTCESESSGVTTTYTYDDNNNRQTKTVTGGPDAGTTRYLYDDNNRLKNETEKLSDYKFNVTKYDYDNNGNQLCSEKTSYNNEETMSFKDSFDTGMNKWTVYDGSWTINNNEYVVAPINNTGKTIVKDLNCSNFVMEADVKIESATGEAGLIFRVNKTSQGDLNGYYVGLNCQRGKIVLGKMKDKSYVELSSSSLTVIPSTSYHIKIVAEGTQMRVYLGSSNIGTIGGNDSEYKKGTIGLCVSNSGASFDNVTVTNLMPKGIGNFERNSNDVTFNAWQNNGGYLLFDNSKAGYPNRYTYAAVFNDSEVSNFSFEVDVDLSKSSFSKGAKAGIVFRVTNTEDMDGFFWGIDAANEIVELCGWTTTSYGIRRLTTNLSRTMSIDGNSNYHLKVVLEKGSLYLYAGLVGQECKQIASIPFSVMIGKVGVMTYNVDKNEYFHYDNMKLVDLVGSSSQKVSVTKTTNKYDGLNQLKSTQVGDKLVDYSYNADGLRTSKSVNGVATKHIWDGQNIVMETDSSGNIIGKYLRGINLIAWYDKKGTKKLYVYNGHGDVVQLVNAEGSAIQQYCYDSFGNEKKNKVLYGDVDGNGVVNDVDVNLVKAYTVGSINSFPCFNGKTAADVNGDGVVRSNDYAIIRDYIIKKLNSFPADTNLDGIVNEAESVFEDDLNAFRYGGEYWDKETGTYYLRARYYNPATGRFITEDSYTGNAQDPLSLNLYTYCHNDPVNFWDPNGHRDVQLREIALEYGGDVDYDDSTRTATVTVNDVTKTYNLDDSTTRINENGHIIVDDAMFRSECKLETFISLPNNQTFAPDPNFIDKKEYIATLSGKNIVYDSINDLSNANVPFNLKPSFYIGVLSYVLPDDVTRPGDRVVMEFYKDHTTTRVYDRITNKQVSEQVTRKSLSYFISEFGDKMQDIKQDVQGLHSFN